MVPRRKVFLGVVVTANALLWLIPSNVVELVARDRHTLLGRYSREHFSWIVALVIMSVVGLYIELAPDQKRKKRWFQVIAVLLLLVPTIGVVDYIARSPEQAHYTKDSLSYHRPVSQSFTVQFEDRPQAGRTYPNAPEGAGTVECVYHTDARGFRNLTGPRQYDVVVLGDSFTEGSSVSDDHPWPVRFAARSQLAVYNMGMSGYGPVNYLASLRDYALDLSPRVVMCMLYEGNDFRSGKLEMTSTGPGLSKRIKTYFKQSPIRSGIDRLFTEVLGTIGSRRQVSGLEVLSWLPLTIPGGPGSKHYAFAPKQLLQSYVSVEDFGESKQWRAVAGVLSEMKRVCRSGGVELVIVYAPTKAHVMMPLVRDRLRSEKVRAFAALRTDKLPAADEFVDNLFSYLSSKSSTVRDWCLGEGVPFIDATEALRRSAAGGQQVYYTYDQHWTPAGHDVVAAVVNNFWGEGQLGVTSGIAFRD